MPLQDQLKTSYISWLNQRLTMKDLDNGIIQITSPFLDRDNDRLQIYVVPDGDDLKLSDDGYILNELMMSGCNVFSSKKRMEILEVILNSHGIKRNGEELLVKTTLKSFPQKKHSLLQAMLSINDMFMTTRENVTSIFLEEVEKFLDESEARYSENVSFTGKSGFTHHFDFVIPKFKKHPERIIKVINNPTREKSESLLFSWDDTKETRRSDAVLYTFLNDSEKPISKNIISAFAEYNVKPVIWSKRKDYIKELSA
jgi:hypothetical protein